MAMKIKKYIYLMVVKRFNLLTELFQGVNFRKNILIMGIKLPIQIFATIACPKIAYNYTIWIEHRHNVENITIQ